MSIVTLQNLHHLSHKIPNPPFRGFIQKNPHFFLILLRDFDGGTLKPENGRTIREFEMVADSTAIQLNSVISFVSWNVSGKVKYIPFRGIEKKVTLDQTKI